MNSPFSISFEDAISCANEIQTIYSNMGDILERLDQSAKTLYGDNWSGLGSDDAHSFYVSLHEKYESFRDQIDDLPSAIARSNDEYQRSANAASNTITSDNNG